MNYNMCTRRELQVTLQASGLLQDVQSCIFCVFSIPVVVSEQFLLVCICLCVLTSHKCLCYFY